MILIHILQGLLLYSELEYWVLTEKKLLPQFVSVTKLKKCSFLQGISYYPISSSSLSHFCNSFIYSCDSCFLQESHLPSHNHPLNCSHSSFLLDAFNMASSEPFKHFSACWYWHKLNRQEQLFFQWVRNGQRGTNWMEASMLPCLYKKIKENKHYDFCWPIKQKYSICSQIPCEVREDERDRKPVWLKSLISLQNKVIIINTYWLYHQQWCF